MVKIKLKKVPVRIVLKTHDGKKLSFKATKFVRVKNRNNSHGKFSSSVDRLLPRKRQLVNNQKGGRN